MSDERPRGDVYLHGHDEPVLRSHSWRTAENSAAYLLDRLRPDDRLLDVGCGPGTISVDLARRLGEGSVVGIDRSDEVLAGAAELALAAGVDNVEFRGCDVMDLPFEPGSFDVVHAHQVLQHLVDPVGALRGMARVCRARGVVAARDADYGAFVWAPGVPGLSRWQECYREAARSVGAEPDAGRHLLRWCREAGLVEVCATASVWCFSTPEDRTWWSGLWADRVLGTDLTGRLRDVGASEDDLEEMAEGWRRWGVSDDGWFVVLHGEVVARVA